jgi:sugar phosphate isomerase/epimerase
VTTPPPFRLGYGTNGFTDHPLPVALDVLDGAGYDAVGLTVGFPHLDPFSTTDRDLAELGDRLAGLRGGAGVAVVVETGTRYLLDPVHKHRPTLVDRDADVRMRYLNLAVDVAAALDAQCVSFFSGILPTGDRPEEGWARLRDRVPRVVEHARERGVRLSLEPEPGMLVETVADAVRLLEELGTPPQLGITVDVGHCLVVEPDGVVGALRTAAPFLANVQLDDMPSTHHEHRPFGEGELDLPAALNALDEIGYEGLVAVELSRHSHKAHEMVPAAIRALRGAAVPT